MDHSPEQQPVGMCAAEPCPDCPWRVANHGRRSGAKVEGESYGWFTQRNRDRLWARLRRGEAMTCHPTDPRDERHGAAPGTKTKECAGAVILQQRELVILQRLLRSDADTALASYRTARPAGLTREGMAVLAWNAQMGAVPLLGGRQMGRPNLNAAVAVGPGRLAWPPRSV